LDVAGVVATFGLGIVGRVSSARLKAALAHVPAWYLWFQAFSFLDSEVRLLDPPRRDFAFTALFPLAWFAAYYLVRPRDDRTRNRRKDVLVVSLSCLVPAILILWVIPPTPKPHEAMMRGAEIARLFFSVLLAIHCWLATSRATFVKFFGVALVYGAILENGGILGGFFSEPGYLLYVPHLPAPVVNIVGWSVGLYVSVYLWQQIFERFEFRRFKTTIFAAGVTAVAVSQDLQIDPFATHSRWWIWHESLPAAFLGVPLLNFLAWIAAVFPFAWLYHYIETRTGMEENRRVVRLFVSIPIVLAAALAIVLLLTVIFRGPGSADIEIFKRAVGVSAGAP
jgi:hypothetical protein